LFATPAKIVRFRGDEEKPSQCATPVRLPQRSMEEVGSSSARGEEAIHARKGQVGGLQRRPPWRGRVFSSTRRKKRSMHIEVSADSSSDDPGRRVVLVDLISSGDDSGNNSGDDSDDDSEYHEASSETITHEICHWTFTSSLINCSNASISICSRKLLHMTLTGFGLKSTSSRNRLKRSRQVLKPVRAKIAFL
jgi:hypothetical protein